MPEPRPVAAQLVGAAGPFRGIAVSLASDPLPGLIAYARRLVGKPDRELDLAVVFNTIDSVLEQAIAAMPEDRPTLAERLYR